MKQVFLYFFLLLLPIFLFAQSNSKSYEYDYVNRITKIDYGNGTVIEYSYDAVGNRTTHVITVQTIRLQTKIFLEGPYNASTDEMSTELKNNGYVPAASPYSEDARTAASVPNNVTDWVLVQLRSSATGAAIVSKSAFLRKDGKIVADDGTTEYIELRAQEGNYYIVIKHRNHLSIMSANTVALNGTGSTLYDFSTGTDRYYGSEAVLLESGVYGMYAGDTNDSDIITYSDKDPINDNVNYAGYHSADANCSGIVTYADKDFINSNVNKASNVPSPTMQNTVKAKTKHKIGRRTRQ